MDKDFRVPKLAGLTEHLVFIALLLPTFVLLTAVAVSLASPDPTNGVQPAVQTAMACEPCIWDNGEQGP